MNNIKNHYYSRNAFESLVENSWSDEVVCEVKINGEWRVFTEQIDLGYEPLSYRWGDLESLGEGSERRYMRFSKWFHEKEHVLQ